MILGAPHPTMDSQGSTGMYQHRALAGDTQAMRGVNIPGNSSLWGAISHRW